MAKIDIAAALGKSNSSLHCVFCKQDKKTSDFYVSHSNHAMLRIGTDKKPHSILCKDCTQALYEYFFRLFKSKQKALYQVCAALDLFYSDELFEIVQDSDMALFIDRYMTAYFTQYRDAPKTFIDTFKDKKLETDKIKTTKIERPKDDEFTEEDLKNRREVISIFHYDPFENEEPAVRKKLTLQLCTMCDDSLREDLIRQRAALEIVRSFARIDEWTATIDAITKDPKKMQTQAKDLKVLIETKQKEMAQVSQMCKDNQFSSHYASQKSRGGGTLGGIMRDMEDFNYDDGKVNMYDIRTSESIQQIADTSFQAIMKQLKLNEADYIDMVKRQREENTQLRDELMKTKEALRLVYRQLSKEELLKELGTELIKKGLTEAEVTQAILDEVHYDDELIKKAKRGDK